MSTHALVAAAARSTVTGLFVQQARLYPDRIAVDDGERRFSYAELERRSARLAGMLAAHGVGEGDRIAILSENRIEYLEALLAAGCIGAIVACQNWRLARPELAHCLAQVVAKEPLGWLLLMPGMVRPFADVLEAGAVRANGVRVCGVMADLVPPADIARITRLLDAPYANTFGATETGCPPCSSSLIPIGETPQRLSKVQSPFCEVRLVDPDDHDVPDGSPGELAMRGPTLFSGYWQAEQTNRSDFQGGWFHMGDVFVRNPDGTLDFVDRVKYLIKTGGENVYPAEIERVMFSDSRVRDVAVVRRADARWGEVPVAFVARHDDSLDADALRAICRASLAGYKQPKGIAFIDYDEFPRSASGKIQRHELEKRLDTTRFD